MSTDQGYAPKDVWDAYHTSKEEVGDDLNPSGWWAERWLEFIKHHPIQTIIDLGCGTGGDSLVVARSGYTATGIDFSQAAIDRARRKAAEEGLPVRFQVADLAAPLPFDDAVFDATMGNVSLHLFSDAVTHQVFAEIWRIVRSGGYVMFHVNSVQDMPYRAKRYTRVEELEPYFYREVHGQTMHFFTKAYCYELLSNWKILSLRHLELSGDNGEVFKCVWQAVGQKP